MNKKEEERRARLLKLRAERLPDIKRQFEEAQNRNFNSNFKPGGKDEALVKPKKTATKKATKAAKAVKEPTAKEKAKAETPVNVDIFKGIPQYLAYFQHCFDLDPTRTYLRYYYKDVQVSEDLRKKFKYKGKNRELYRQMFKLLKVRDDAELPDSAAGGENAEDGDDGENDEKKADAAGEKKAGDDQQSAEEKKEDKKA